MSLYYLQAVLGLAVLIVVHEFGHFAAARLLGLTVYRFSVGFGPRLWGFKRGATEYQLAAVPLGGFVHIKGMALDEPVRPGDRTAFANRGGLARLIVLLAGPVMNYVMAAATLATLIAWGVSVPSSGAVVGTVVPDRPAAAAGLRTDDRILAIDGQGVAESWVAMAEAINASAGRPMDLTVKRGDAVLHITLAARRDPGSERWIIGIGPGRETFKAGPLEAVWLGFARATTMAGRVLMDVADIFTGRRAGEVTGPAGIIKMAGQAASEGFASFAMLLTILNVYLCLFNLFPLPALDGGRILFLGIEAVRRRPVNRRVETAVHAIGLVLLLALIVAVTIKDILTW
jgi:regulator of sigma E protease